MYAHMYYVVCSYKHYHRYSSEWNVHIEIYPQNQMQKKFEKTDSLTPEILSAALFC